MIMESGNKKKEGEIDEAYLMSIMAGGVRKEGLEDKKAVPEPNPSIDSKSKKKKKSVLKDGADDYETLFFSNAESNARNGKSVYIRPEFHERLTRIVQVIGEDKISLYAYLDNVLQHHFKEFGEQIKTSFDDKYKPIL